ncbi:MAG: ABC transporter substrate-binding protein [Betaproteobacteria bacterium]|nr:ABC transporter substrate-binding protein [Betaproteobacteria bacterium]
MKFLPVLALAAGLFSASLHAEPIRIGLTGPFTGGSSPMGISMRDGVRLAAAEINAAGGVLGRRILLIERDDEARNDLGARIAREIIHKQKIVAGLGNVNTGVALASAKFYQDARIPLLTNVATGTLVTKQFLPPRHAENYIFRLAANDTIQAAMIVNEAVDRLKIIRLAIFADATHYGQLGREDLEQALAAKGIKPVTVQKFNIRDTDMTRQLQEAKRTRAHAILTYGIGPELAQIAVGMERVGWRVPLIGSWTLSMSNFIDNAGPHAEGARMPQTFIQDPNTPKRRAFIETYQNRYRVDRIPSPVSAAQGYDSMHLLAAAIEQAGSTDGPKIRAALENLKDRIEGVITTYDHPYSADDHEAISVNIPVMGVVKDGRVVYAYEEDRAGPPVRLKGAGTKPASAPPGAH